MPDDDGPVSEHEQDQYIEALHRHLAAGRLDLSQFDVRAARMYAAGTRAGARAALDGLPMLDATASSTRPSRRRRAEGEPVRPQWVATDEVFRDPSSGRVIRVWVDPIDGTRHYAQSLPRGPSSAQTRSNVCATGAQPAAASRRSRSSAAQPVDRPALAPATVGAPPVPLHLGQGGEPDVMCCQACGRRQTVDPVLPYVHQAAAFATDHRCNEADGDGPGQCRE